MTRAKSGRISFLDVLSAVPPFLSHAREAKPAESRDRSQSTIKNFNKHDENATRTANRIILIEEREQKLTVKFPRDL